METLYIETDEQKIWENFRKMAKSMGVELPKEDPCRNRADGPR